MVVELDQDDKAEIYEYLNGLRESGRTNMFGAAAYLERDMFMSKELAKAWLTDWMKNC